MSHDLRTPINGILGFTGLALHERDPEKKQDYMRLSGSAAAPASIAIPSRRRA